MSRRARSLSCEPARPLPRTVQGCGRDFIGDSPDLTDAQFLEAARQWWRCEPEMIVTTAGVLPVSVAGWGTGVLAIHGTDSILRPARRGRRSFTATVAGRVGSRDVPETFRVLTLDPAMAGLTRMLPGDRVRSAVSGVRPCTKAREDPGELMSDFETIDALPASASTPVPLPPAEERRALPRGALGLSRTQVARACGVSPSTPSGWEWGIRA